MLLIFFLISRKCKKNDPNQFIAKEKLFEIEIIRYNRISFQISRGVKIALIKSNKA